MQSIRAPYLISLAKDKFPLSVSYKGKLTEDELTEIEQYCDLHCSSIFMDGSAVYNIRHKKKLLQ